MTVLRIVLVGGFLCLGIFLFVSAPPKLPDGDMRAGRCKLPVQDLFEAANHINHAARSIYTKRIVGGGKKAGLKFGEDWQEPDVEQGPLPALFLRASAAQLEAMPPRLGLYLGSDAPINPSNLFTDAQLAVFEEVKSTRLPKFSSSDLVGEVAMYPDFASVAPCVDCHNEHTDSPKTDWKIDDVMGATTWTYPSKVVSSEEFWAVTAAMFEAVERTYTTYLDKSQGFESPPEIGGVWPDAGKYTLPQTDIFLSEVRLEAAPKIMKTFLNSHMSNGEPLDAAAAPSGAAVAATLKENIACAF